MAWRGKEVLKELTEILSESLVDYDLEFERAAKNELWPGRGVDTGSMQSSVHAAPATYNYPGDHSYPDGPERGGRRFQPTLREKRIEAAVGSGQNYAIFYHQPGATRSWGGHPFIVNAFERTKSLMAGIVTGRVSKHRAK